MAKNPSRIAHSRETTSTKGKAEKLINKHFLSFSKHTHSHSLKARLLSTPLRKCVYWYLLLEKVCPFLQFPSSPSVKMLPIFEVFLGSLSENCGGKGGWMTIFGGNQFTSTARRLVFTAQRVNFSTNFHRFSLFLCYFHERSHTNRNTCSTRIYTSFFDTQRVDFFI